MEKKTIIDLKKINVSLGDKKILEDINLSINRGEFIAVLGPNGSGKSTLFKLILGLIKPKSGKIKVFGKEMRESGNAEIGYSPQVKPFDPDIPIRGKDYVSMGMVKNSTTFFFLNKRKKDQVNKILEELDASELGKKKLGKMSGGEQQRISLAMALVDDPHMLLLDEPLANLDISYQSEILKRISDYHKEHCHTVLLVTHDINPLLPYVDRVLYLANSHAKIGSVEEVINDKVLSDLYQTPVKVFDVDGRIFVAANENLVH